MQEEPTDYTPEDIRHMINRKGMTFATVDRMYGLVPGTARKTARVPHIDGELAIAEALSLSPRQIWPSRFNAKTGNRLRPQPSKNYTAPPRFRASQKGAQV